MVNSLSGGGRCKSFSSQKVAGLAAFCAFFNRFKFPFAMVTKFTPAGMTTPFPVVGIYSAFAWSLLAVVVLTVASKKPKAPCVSAAAPQLISNLFLF